MAFVAWFTWRAYTGPQVGAGQSRRASIIEAWINILFGFSLNFCANFVLLPLLGSCTRPDAWQNFMLGWVYTVISMVRQYSIRRWFNDYFHAFSTWISNLAARTAERQA